MREDIVDLHTHTLASGHAYNTIEEMIAQAEKKGVKLLGITEHAPMMPGTCHIYYFQNLHVLERHRSGMQILFGAEVNILDDKGSLDLEDQVLAKLDVNIASLHPPCICFATKKENTDAIIHAMSNPYISIIGHPDDGRFPLDYERLVRAAKETGTILEVNNASLSPNSFRPNTMENDLTMLSYCKEFGVPIIMGSDAHVANDILNHRNSERVLAQCAFPDELVLNDKPQQILSMIRKKRAKTLTN